MMEDLNELVHKGQTLWNSSNGSREKFAKGCAALLEDFDLNLSGLAPLESLISNVTLPKQHFDHDHFADYAVTVARSEDCFIDIYVWQKRSTNYHSHHFCGAFKALSGKARQAHLEFKATEDFDFMQTGKLTLVSTSDLKEGEVQTILPGEKFIHRSHYVSRPGITVCLRSNDLNDVDIYSYFYPGLAIKHHKLTSSQIRHLKLVEFMHKNDRLESQEVETFYKRLPNWTKYELLTGFTRIHTFIEDPSFLLALEQLAHKDDTLIEGLKTKIKDCRQEHLKKFRRDLMLLDSFGWNKNG